MKTVTGKSVYIAVFLGMALILTGCIYCIFFPAGKINVHSDTFEDLLSQLKDNIFSSPCGKLENEVLNWEEERPFLRLCGQQGAVMRLAAYKIFIPDLPPGEKSNVDLAAKLLAGKVVAPGERFSLNGAVGPYSRKRGFQEGPAYSGGNVVKMVGGGVCKIATTLYNTAVLANMEVLERHPHNMLVPYVLPGQDAAIVYAMQDFSFRNNTEHPLVIWSGTGEDTLTIAMYGSTAPPRVTWRHELLNWQKRPTVYRNNPNLIPGEEKIITSGADSVTVKSWLVVDGFDGTQTTKKMGTSYYSPLPRVIEKIFLD